MPAFLRMEIFPSNLQTSIDFYTEILKFTLLRHEHDYAYFQRDNIFIGAATDAIHTEGAMPVDSKFRRPPTGVELVIEVDDLDAERDFIVDKGYRLNEDIKLQEWKLRDFRLIDPDGYYLRFTEHSPDKNGRGA